jgi:hypothetical protein
MTLVANVTSNAAVAEDTLVRLDAIAGSFLAALAPIRYAVASSDSECEQVFRLRFRAVIDRGWLKPEDLPGGIERETDDDRAVLVGAWDGTTPVAAARLIFPVDGQRLPVETAFGLDLTPYDMAVQVDRMTVDRAFRDRGSRLLLGLIARCWLEIRARGFHIWTGIDSPGMFRLYRKLGFEATILGPSRTYWGEDRFPILCDPVAAAPALLAHLGDQT